MDRICALDVVKECSAAPSTMPPPPVPEPAAAAAEDDWAFFESPLLNPGLTKDLAATMKTAAEVLFGDVADHDDDDGGSNDSFVGDLDEQEAFREASDPEDAASDVDAGHGSAQEEFRFEHVFALGIVRGSLQELLFQWYAVTPARLCLQNLCGTFPPSLI